MSFHFVDFGLGIGIGGILGFILAKKWMRKQVDREVNDVLEKIYEEKRAKEREAEAELEKEEALAKEKADDLYNNAAEALKKYGVRSDPEKNYGKGPEWTAFRYPDPAEMESPEDDFSEEEEAKRFEELVKEGAIVTEENENDIAGEELTAELSKKPILISSDDFDYGRPEFDKVQLVYYVGDDTLIEAESEEEVMDEERVLGNCLNESGMRDPENTEDVIFVRNFAFNTDYEISKSWLEFAEIAMK